MGKGKNKSHVRRARREAQITKDFFGTISQHVTDAGVVVPEGCKCPDCGKTHGSKDELPQKGNVTQTGVSQSAEEQEKAMAPAGAGDENGGESSSGLVTKADLEAAEKGLMDGLPSANEWKKHQERTANVKMAVKSSRPTTPATSKASDTDLAAASAKLLGIAPDALPRTEEDFLAMTGDEQKRLAEVAISMAQMEGAFEHITSYFESVMAQAGWSAPVSGRGRPRKDLLALKRRDVEKKTEEAYRKSPCHPEFEEEDRRMLTREDLQPERCQCRGDRESDEQGEIKKCGWSCPECVYRALQGYLDTDAKTSTASKGKKPIDPSKPAAPTESKPAKPRITLKSMLMKDPTRMFKYFRDLLTAWTLPHPKKLHKENIRKFAKCLKTAYPIREVSMQMTDCDACYEDDELRAINEAISERKGWGLPEGKSVVFSKDIQAWVALMVLIGHTFAKRIWRFVVKEPVKGTNDHATFHPIWFHEENGDLEKLYLDISYILLRSLMYSRAVPVAEKLVQVSTKNKFKHVDMMFFEMTEKAVIGLFVDMERTIDGLGGRSGTMGSWTEKAGREHMRLSKEQAAWIVAEMCDGGPYDKP